MLPAATARTAQPGGKRPPRVPSTADALALARSLDPADRILAKLKALPPGNAQDLALALFLSRTARRPAGGGGEPKEFNPFAELPAGAKPSTNGRHGIEWFGACRPENPWRNSADLPFGTERDPFASSGTLLGWHNKKLGRPRPRRGERNNSQICPPENPAPPPWTPPPSPWPAITLRRRGTWW